MTPRRAPDASSVAGLTDAVAAILGDYVQSGRERTDLLRLAAEKIVNLRQHFTLADGRVDWSGRSPKYRALMQEIYARAHVPADRYDTVQAALRYHVGNLLRETADKDDLASVGLTAVAPRERLARNRAVVAAIAETGKVGDITSDPLRLITYAEALLDHVAPASLEALQGAERGAARHALEGLSGRVEELRPLVAGRRRRHLGPV